MKLIPLSQEKFAQVDDKNFDWLNQWKWHATKDKNNWYARRKITINGKDTKIIMHRLILNTQKGMFCDHKDFNGLNNQESNLRNCTHAQNNKHKQSQKNSSSKYLGVSFNKRQKKWKAAICVNYKHIFLGLFKTEIEAALAYNEAAKKYHGEFANLNIIS